MLDKKEYYEIFIYNNEVAVVEKIDDDMYNDFKDTYPLNENFDPCKDTLIVEEEHLSELLDDLREQGFCKYSMKVIE